MSYRISVQKTKEKDQLRQTVSSDAKIVRTTSSMAGTGSPYTDLYHENHQYLDRPESVPAAGYFWNTTCAPETCKEEWKMVCPPGFVCQRCGLIERNSPVCPKASFWLTDFIDWFYWTLLQPLKGWIAKYNMYVNTIKYKILIIESTIQKHA